MSIVKLQVNGAAHEVDVDPSTPLLYVLRNDLDLHGPRFGCGLGQCGVCTVIIDGAAVRSCMTPVSAVKGEITTLEGLSKEGKLHPLQQAWIEEQAAQCGYCQNGQIMTAKALLDRNPNPSDAEIREGMEGALCRCMTYYRIHAAIKRVVRAARLQGRQMSALRLPKAVEEAILRGNPSSRRSFLKSSGALVFSLSVATARRQRASPRRQRQRPDRAVSRSRLPATRHLDRDSS